jgi:flavin reductase (DIM6/NTAB) family NADH-FMN oxidoreductase RutF
VSALKARLLFLNYYKTPQTDFHRLKALAAAFSYPRQVRVVSFGQGDQYNIFPMDLLGEMNAGGNYVFGLRHSNASLAKMMETKKMVVSEVGYEHKDAIYQLGKYHSSTIPPPDSLPFPLVKSEQFGFYVPAWADSYAELDIVKTLNLGSHMLLWAKPVSRTRLKDSTGHLFHLHSLAWLRQRKNGQPYSLV